MTNSMTSRSAPARWALTALATLGLSLLLPAGVAVADDDPPPTPTPSPGAVTVTKAGTSFLTATHVEVGTPVRLPASIGDYLYWSFTAEAGETHQIAITVSLPATGERHGDSTWTVDVFDGLRRRQACTSGAQTPTAGAGDVTVTLGCTLRQVRGWAEPWSGDPLPGRYYVRLAVIELAEQDLGLPVQVDMIIGLRDRDDPLPEGGRLRAPLVPAVDPGVAEPNPMASGAAGDDATEEEVGLFERFGGWLADLLPDLSSRWVWTTVGGILAAIGGVIGFSLTRRPRRHPVG